MNKGIGNYHGLLSGTPVPGKILKQRIDHETRIIGKGDISLSTKQYWSSNMTIPVSYATRLITRSQQLRCTAEADYTEGVMHFDLALRCGGIESQQMHDVASRLGRLENFATCCCFCGLYSCTRAPLWLMFASNTRSYVECRYLRP
jgi:hypothetical protein